VRLERAIGVIYRPRPDGGATTPVRAWRISSTLSSRVRSEFPQPLEDGVEKLVRTTLEILKGHVTEGEWRDIRSVLPKDLQKLLP
jgi:hypothetical protein